MFNQKEIEAYQSITAPDDLQEKIMASYDLDHTLKHILYSGKLRIISSIAVCMVLIITVSVFAFKDTGEFSALVNGQKLSSESTLISDSQPALMTADARSLSVVSVPIELDISKDTEIAVNNGIIQILDNKTGDVLSSETVFCTDTKTFVCWEVTIDGNTPSYEMTVSDAKKNYVITLAFDDKVNEWTICCEATD